MSYLMLPLCDCSDPAFCEEDPVNSLVAGGCLDGVIATATESVGGAIFRRFYSVSTSLSYPQPPTNFASIDFGCQGEVVIDVAECGEIESGGEGPEIEPDGERPTDRPDQPTQPEQAQGPSRPDPQTAQIEAHMNNDPMRRCKGCG